MPRLGEWVRPLIHPESAAILDGFPDVQSLRLRCSIHVGQRTRDLQDTVMGSRGPLEAMPRLFKQVAPTRVRLASRVECACV
jgi:hypothetical protein